MDWTLLKIAAESATKLLPTLLRKNARMRKEWKTAISKLQVAVLETQLYAASLERGKRVNRKEERKLVGKWRAAAEEFYGIDGALAERLQLKAEYWTTPESWTAQEIHDAGIALQHVAERTRQLLYESN
jgi:hypothetical protein